MATASGDSANKDGAGSFRWLALDREPSESVAGGGRPPIRTAVAATHPRLDPLTLQGVINRVLVLVLCLLAIGAAYEAIGSLASHAPPAAAVTPVALSGVVRTSVPKPKARPKPKALPKPTTRTTPTTQAAVTTLPTTPPTSPPATAPRFTAPPVQVQSTPPATSPPVIQVPSSPTTAPPSGPSDTIAVPFQP